MMILIYILQILAILFFPIRLKAEGLNILDKLQVYLELFQIFSTLNNTSHSLTMGSILSSNIEPHSLLKIDQSVNLTSLQNLTVFIFFEADEA